LQVGRNKDWHDRPMGHEHVHEPATGTDALRQRGRRITRQRRLIWDALVERPDSHLSAEDVVERVRGQLPKVDPSTVYRTLDLLVREGLVRRTDLGAGRAFFEPAQEHLHHHVVCERCGAVAHLHDEEVGDVRERVERASGYALSRNDMSFYGLCPDCR
jgi:Fur family transcriptional regulator, ferric uptake regulator